MKLLLSCLMLSALSAAAEPVARAGSGSACSDGTGFENRSLVLWVTDKTNPDEAPCLARLAYARCENEMTDDAPVATGGAKRYFVGEGVVALLTVEPAGGVRVELRFAGALGMRAGVASLGTYPYQRAVYRGIGVDKATAYDLQAGASRVIGNVFLIPAENLTERALKLCPAGR